MNINHYPKSTNDSLVLSKLVDLITNNNTNNNLINLNINQKKDFINLIKNTKQYYIDIISNIKYNIKDNLDENELYNIQNMNNDYIDNRFIPNKLKENIQKNYYKYKKLIIFNYNNYDITFLLQYSNKNEITKIFNKIYILAIRTFIINILFCNIQSIRYNIILSDLKKSKNIKTKILSPNEINTGSTLAVGYKPINIWRKEELVKVGIHELIHCLRFDIKYYPTDLVKMYYNNFCIEVNNCNFDDYFNCSNLIFPNEAYTESIAQIFNCLFREIEYSLLLKYNNNNTIYKKFINNLEKELVYGLFQVKKILNLYNFNKFKDFIKGKKCVSTLIQQTNVFSYFFIRTSILLNLSDFINLLNSYDNKQDNKQGIKQDNLLELRIKNSYNIIKKFTLFNIKNLKNKNFNKLIELYNKNINTIISENFNSNEIKIINNNLRMSIVEF